MVVSFAVRERCGRTTGGKKKTPQINKQICKQNQNQKRYAYTGQEKEDEETDAVFLRVQHTGLSTTAQPEYNINQ